MKNILIILLCFVCSINANAQLPDGLDNIELEAFESDETVARESIHLKPGFNTVGQPSYHAYIDEIIPINGYASGKFNLNYMRVYSPIKNNKTTSLPVHNEIDLLNEWAEQITYYDGLGKPIQMIDVMASPQGRDLIKIAEYDQFGRQFRDYKPYTVRQKSDNGPGGFRPLGIEEQKFVVQTLNQVSHDYTYSESIFDNPIANQIIEQSSPGESWSLESNNTLKSQYETNTNATEVVHFTVTNDGKLQKSGHYATGTLYKNKKSDEDGRYQFTYTDKSGKQVLQTIGPEKKIYYVYDKYELLRYVISPKAVSNIVSATGIIGDYSTNQTIDQLCYYYEYDEKNRLIKKKLPGKQIEFMVYDYRDRIILSQDGNQRLNSKWVFNKYDKYNRLIISGEYTNSNVNTQEGMLALVYSFYSDNSHKLYEEPDLQQDLGYTNQSFPELNSNNFIFSINYYDNYDFISQPEYAPFAFEPNGLVYEYDNTHLKGKLTTSRVQVLPSESGNYANLAHWLTKSYYYDEYGRPVQLVSNTHTGGMEILSSKFNFAGELITSLQEIQTSSTSTAHTIQQWFSYDHRGRLVSEKHKIDNNETIELSKQLYNEYGLLAKKSLHKTANASGFSQDIDYRYNIRDWLTDINNTDGIGNNFFAMKLEYNSSTNPQYNGNISIQTTRYANRFQRYSFTYDQYSQLLSATHNGDGAYGSAYAYDLNGNITHLNRDGRQNESGQYGGIDDLSYVYKGNQLKKVDDNDQLAAYMNNGFRDNGSFQNVEYLYDANGNMILDKNKENMTVDYNYLNLPQKINRICGPDINKIYYLYAADGNKLQKHTQISGGTLSTTDYVGSFQLIDGQEKSLAHSEGRIMINNDGSFDYQYYLKDHLGNVRIVFNDEGLVQQDGYYPFGMLMQGCGGFEAQNDPNKYLYNGKELQNEFGLEWYDYGARLYDPVLGRLHSLDPMADLLTHFSPYNYCFNNPLIYTDPTGMIPYIYNWEKKQYEDEDGKKVEFDVVMDYLLENSTIVGREEGSGKSVKNGGAKKTIDFVNNRINDVSTVDEYFNIARTGSSASKAINKAGQASGWFGFASGLYDVYNGGNPIEAMPFIGGAVTAIWDNSGIDDIENEVDFAIAQRSYGDMVNYAVKNQSIVFIYTSKDIFVDPKNNLYNVPASYRPTSVPFMDKFEADNASGANLNYVYWGVRQMDGSMVVQGKFNLE